ncbi:MAG TPA: hypothetical protein VLV54_01935 [Thermoanaerobaculia bacterium]|nr:hypothetical protein [Thermoanaerobaculia bacterium]
MRPFVVIVLLISICSPSRPAGAESFCDPNIPPSKPGATTYRMRGDRCEGIFAQQVSSPHLEIRSLVGSFPTFDPKKDSELVLVWKVPPGSKADVQLRAFSFKPGTYYRMDTRVHADHSAFHWPTDLLDSEGLGRADLGLLAWTESNEPEGTKTQVYLPLSTGTGAAKTKDGYTVTFLPSTRLSEVHVKISRLGGQGGAPAVVRDDKLIDDYYAPSEPKAFPTGKLGPAGFYRVILTALPKTGNPIVQDFELYHSGD